MGVKFHLQKKQDRPCGCVGEQGNGGTFFCIPAQQDCTGPFPLEGRTELLLSWPQYSISSRPVVSSGALAGEGIGSRMVCVRPQGLLPDPSTMNRSLLTLLCFPPSYYAKLRQQEIERERELAEKYRDRAKERRDGVNKDYEETELISTTANYRAVGPTAEAYVGSAGALAQG